MRATDAPHRNGVADDTSATTNRHRNAPPAAQKSIVPACVYIQNSILKFQEHTANCQATGGDKGWRMIIKLDTKAFVKTMHQKVIKAKAGDYGIAK